MKIRSGEKIRLASVEEFLGVPDGQNATEIEIAKIRPFPNYPFQVRDDDQIGRYFWKHTHPLILS